MCVGTDQKCSNCVWGDKFMIVLKCVGTRSASELYSVQDQLNQVPCKSIAFCYDSAQTQLMLEPNVRQTFDMDQGVLIQNWVPTHIEIRFADSKEETLWALSHADLIADGIEINIGTDIIHRTFPVADAFAREDSDCIRLKELN